MHGMPDSMVAKQEGMKWFKVELDGRMQFGKLYETIMANIWLLGRFGNTSKILVCITATAIHRAARLVSGWEGGTVLGETRLFNAHASTDVDTFGSTLHTTVHTLPSLSAIYPVRVMEMSPNRPTLSENLNLQHLRTTMPATL